MERSDPERSKASERSKAIVSCPENSPITLFSLFCYLFPFLQREWELLSITSHKQPQTGWKRMVTTITQMAKGGFFRIALYQKLSPTFLQPTTQGVSQGKGVIWTGLFSAQLFLSLFRLPISPFFSSSLAMLIFVFCFDLFSCHHTMVFGPVIFYVQVRPIEIYMPGLVQGDTDKVSRCNRGQGYCTLNGSEEGDFLADTACPGTIYESAGVRKAIPAETPPVFRRIHYIFPDPKLAYSSTLFYSSTLTPTGWLLCVGVGYRNLQCLVRTVPLNNHPMLVV